MTAQRDITGQRKDVHQSLSYGGPIKIVSAVALLALGTAVIFALPDGSDNRTDKPQIPSTTAQAPDSAAAPDESLCDKQAWPYVDQRCVQRVEAARGMRQVRIVTDKGHSVTAMTPEPIVEPKQTPAPRPAVAQTDKPMGPPAAPMAAASAPQTATAAAPKVAATPPAPKETTAAAPQSAPAPKVAAAPAPNPPAAEMPPDPASTASTGRRETQKRVADRGPADVVPSIVSPAAASATQPAAGMDAFAETPKKSAREERAEKRAIEKAEREKAEKREAKRRKQIEVEGGNSGGPEEVVTAVKSTPAGSRNGGNARRGVPDEVVAAVEEAAAESRRGGRRGGMVTLEAPSDSTGRRIYVVRP